MDLLKQNYEDAKPGIQITLLLEIKAKELIVLLHPALKL